MRPKIVAIAAGVVIVAFVVISVPHKESPSVVAEARRATPTAPTNSQASATPMAIRDKSKLEGARAVHTPPNVARITPQSTQFFDSTDLKQIVDRARSNPSAGSYYYATLALRECETTLYSRLAAVEQATDFGGSKREVMLAKAQERCRNVDDEGGKLLRRLGDEGLAAGDVVFASLAPLQSKVGTPRSGADLINALYTLDDAGALAMVLNELAVRSDSLQVHGRQLSEAEKSSLPAALLLLGCEMGVPCDDRNPLVRSYCISRGRCEDDLPTLLRRFDVTEWIVYTRGSRFDYQTAVALKQELGDAIARGDRAALRSLPG